jgi:hypothetical protein
MTRKLSNMEVFDFLGRHPEVNNLVAQHEHMLQSGGWVWDQTQGGWNAAELVELAAAGAFTLALPIPPRGLAVDDDVYGSVVIFPDARGLLHFTSTDNQSLVTEVRKPYYYEDPRYWELFEDLAKKAKEAIPLGLGLGAIALMVVAGMALSGRSA